MLLVEPKRLVLLRVGVERRWVVFDPVEALHFVTQRRVAAAPALPLPGSKATVLGC
jgi:hypothetical protein